MYVKWLWSWLPKICSHELLEPSACRQEKLIGVSFISMPCLVCMIPKLKWVLNEHECSIRIILSAWLRRKFQGTTVDGLKLEWIQLLHLFYAQVGTLDTLVSLSDQLAKLDPFVEGWVMLRFFQLLSFFLLWHVTLSYVLWITLCGCIL